MNATPASCAADLVELAPVIIHEIRKTIRREMDARISLVQVRLLAVVARQRGISVSDAADHVGLGVPATSALVEVLVKRGLLVRRTADDDRRRAVLEPSPDGEAILREVRAASSRRIAALIAGLAA